jgi:hypothetical protein
VAAAMPREVLRVVQPGALEAAVMANEEQTRKQDEVLTLCSGTWRPLDIARTEHRGSSGCCRSGQARHWRQTDPAVPADRQGCPLFGATKPSHIN